MHGWTTKQDTRESVVCPGLLGMGLLLAPRVVRGRVREKTLHMYAQTKSCTDARSDKVLRSTEVTRPQEIVHPPRTPLVP